MRILITINGQEWDEYSDECGKGCWLDSDDHFPPASMERALETIKHEHDALVKS